MTEHDSSATERIISQRMLEIAERIEPTDDLLGRVHAQHRRIRRRRLVTRATFVAAGLLAVAGASWLIADSPDTESVIISAGEDEVADEAHVADEPTVDGPADMVACLQDAGIDAEKSGGQIFLLDERLPARTSFTDIYLECVRRLTERLGPAPDEEALLFEIETIYIATASRQLTELIEEVLARSEAATTQSAVPSQSPADAERDGIVPELAQLPAAARINQSDIVLYPDHEPRTRIDTEEGVWLVSSPDLGAVDGLEPGCLLGDTAGTYGVDFICATEYSEILLLDPTAGIVRAFPLPGLPHGSLLLTDDAVYCIRQGDGGLPDSMICRIDRETLAMTLRIFPASLDFVEGQTPILPGWVVDEPTDLVLWQQLSQDGDTLIITGPSGSAIVDPLTLAFVTITSASDVAQLCSTYTTPLESWVADALPPVEGAATDLEEAVDVLERAREALSRDYPTADSIEIGPGFGRAWQGENGGQYEVVPVDDYGILIHFADAADCPTGQDLYAFINGVPRFFAMP